MTSKTNLANHDITHKEVYRLAWPMIVSNCSVPLLGIVDTALLGHLQSPIFLGAVAVGSSVMTFLLWAFGFLRMGTTSQVAQAHGRNDSQRCSQLLIQSAFLAISAAVFLIVFSPLIFGVAIYLMGPSPEVGELAAHYAYIRILSAPATLVTFVIIGWFIGKQRTREPLLIALFVNLLNIVLDWFLIVVMEQNSNGAAIATVIAEYGGLFVGVALIIKAQTGQNLLGSILSTSLMSQVKESRALLRIHGHLFIRTLCLLFVFAFFTSQGARQGEVVLAANAILLQLLALISYGLDGYAHAAEALVGRTYGAKDINNFRRACRYTGQWSAWTAVVYTLAFLFGQPYILAALTSIEPVRLTAAQYFPWLLLLPLISFTSYWLDGVFIGAGKTAAMRNTIILGCFGVYLPLWWLTQSLQLPRVPVLKSENHGLWLALVCFIAARGLIMAYYFRKYSTQNRWFE